MKQITKRVLAIALGIALFFTGSAINNTNKVVHAATTDMLFIGNSMTYYNELQDIFEAFAKKMGKDVNCTAATNGGKNLIYQSTASNVVNAIKKGGYEVVVLQDVVSSFNSGNLLTGAKSIIKTIHQYNPGAKILFYGPWPKENVLTGAGSKLDYFTQGYIQAARENNAVFAPAGEAFYDCFVTNGYNYYADGLHPLPMGSFISATSIYYALYASEGLKTFTSADLADLNAAVNIAQGNKKNYSLSEFNNITAASYKYARAVAPAVADKSGNTKYTSALYKLEDPSIKVSADLSGFSKISTANSTVTVSSSYNSTNTGDKLIDGNKSSRWESKYSDPQYFTIKLDKTYNMNGIKLFWEGAASRKYTIATSTDNANWTQVFDQKNGVGGTESIKFDNVTKANYIRLYSTERTTAYGVSLFEVELYGSVASGSVITPSEPETEAPTQKPEINVDGSNLALNKKAFHSGVEGPGMEAVRAIDGNKGSRFSSDFADNAWMYVDLGNTYSVSKVIISWEGAYGKAYDIQISNDASNWTTVAALRNQNGGEDVITFSPVNARYVRMQGVERALPYGYSMWEFEVYGSTATNNNTNTGTASGTNVALKKTAYQSGIEGPGMEAARAIDGNNGSRFSSNFADNAWMYVDLGSTYNISKVVINWEGAYGKAYDIQVSNDGTNWTTVAALINQNGGEDVITFSPVNAKFVRMQGVERALPYGYSMWEFQVIAN